VQEEVWHVRREECLVSLRVTDTGFWLSTRWLPSLLFFASMHVVVWMVVAVLSTCTHKYDIYLENKGGETI
jgi:hypothetical protein